VLVGFSRDVLVGFSRDVLVGFSRDVLVGFSRDVLVGFSRDVLVGFSREDCDSEVLEAGAIVTGCVANGEATVSWEYAVFLVDVCKKLVWLVGEMAAIFC
jgi:hypothetical protein